MSAPGENSLDIDLVARAVELAVATRADDRAWALVHLAADLRALVRFEEALRVLDVAWHLAPSERPELAMFSCAIEIHCDRGEHELGVKLERSFAERGVDLQLALACLRLYSELYTQTGDKRHRARRDSYQAFLELLESEQGTVAA